MSNFKRKTKHPYTGKWEEANWLDDYYGSHQYAIEFSDGTIISPDKIKTIYMDGNGNIKETK